jgi:2-keto-3-deoxy-L-fuconate dehydrogenase
MNGISYPHRLEGKRALVTAAGQGIGRASAIALANAGASVIATDINDDTLANLSEEASTMSRPGNISCSRLDVLNKDDVNQAISDIQPDILFNCAGYVHHGSILNASEDEWDFAFELNVRAMMRTIKAALPSMIKRGTGSIINMSSACSSIIGAPDRFVYGTSKAAVLGLTKSVARDYITTGVRCNAICPGTVDSPSLHDRLRATGDYDAAMKAFVARQPMGRIATAEEIAALVVYLASDESAFTTGQAHLIDGGWAG